MLSDCWTAFCWASVEAVFEQLEAESVGAHFDALELLNRDADAETLHEDKLCPHYAPVSEKVTPRPQWGLAAQANSSPPSTVSSLRALKL